jgi:hypothetical protein
MIALRREQEYKIFIIYNSNKFYLCDKHNICYIRSLRDSQASKFCAETSAHKIQTTEYHPKEIIQHSEQGESLKSRKYTLFSFTVYIPLYVAA